MAMITILVVINCLQYNVAFLIKYALLISVKNKNEQNKNELINSIIGSVAYGFFPKLKKNPTIRSNDAWNPPISIPVISHDIPSLDLLFLLRLKTLLLSWCAIINVMIPIADQIKGCKKYDSRITLSVTV